jgi:hypothetical protein
LFIGPLKGAMEPYLKTVTLFVNPDQLSALIIMANYTNGNAINNPVSIPFGSGCSQILPFAVHNNEAHAVVGSTDLSMRGYLPNQILSFTMNKKMFDLLCNIGHDSFLEKPYFTDFKKRRES